MSTDASTPEPVTAETVTTGPDIDAVVAQLEDMAERSRRMGIFTDRLFHRGRASGLDDAVRALRAARQ